ncbi:MAG: ASCH domain-containing protein [Planctomycetaceae bacterium]
MNRPADGVPAQIDPDRLALGVQQPWAELILRGIKTLEIRSRPTRVRGPIYLYASRRISALPAAKIAAQRYGIDVDELPRGLLVGSVNISDCRPATSRDVAAACLPAELLIDCQGWHLEHANRWSPALPVRFLPYGVWFYPFRRRP